MSEVAQREKVKAKLSISSIAVLFGVVIPIFYSFGYIYDQGYLNHYGLSNEYFTRTHHEYIFKFFYITVTVLTEILSLSLDNVFYLFLYILLFAGMYFLIEQTRGLGIPKIIQIIVNKIRNNKLFFNLFKSSVVIVNGVAIVSVVAYIIALSLLLLVTPYLMGQKHATKEVTNFVECIEGKPSKQSCTYLYKDKKKLLSGVLIARSDINIAIWNGEKTVFHPLSGESISIEKEIKSIKTNGSK